MAGSLRESHTLGPLCDSAIGSMLIAQLTVIVSAVFPDGRTEAAGNSIAARVAVNVRSGPGTDHLRIGVLYPGELPSIRGSATNGWTPVTWRGRSAWVASAYVTGWDAGEKGFSIGERGFTWMRVRLNARSSPSLSADVRKLFDKSTRVSLTGQVSGQWGQTDLNSDTTWVAIHYLDSFTPEQAVPTPGLTSISATGASGTIGSRQGSTELNLWTAVRGDRFVEVTPKGAKFEITGTVFGGCAQVV